MPPRKRAAAGGSGGDDGAQAGAAPLPAAAEQQQQPANKKTIKDGGAPGKAGKRQPQGSWVLSRGLPLLVVVAAVLAALAAQRRPPDGLAHGSSSSSGSSSSGDASSSGSGAAAPSGAGNATAADEWVEADARGFFPVGCKWREVYRKGEEPGFWGLRRYQFWDAKRGAWGDAQPAACGVRGMSPQGRRWRNGSPRSAANCNDKYCIYDNLWYNNGRWYLLVDGDVGVEPWKLTRNVELNIHHVTNATDFLASTKHTLVAGDTLVFDFVFFLHPTAIGHWSEMLFPLFSILRQERGFARPPTQFVQLHLKRAHMMEWVRATLATALGVGPQRDLPPIMWQHETGHIGEQMGSPLEGFSPSTWVAFDRVMVVKDTYMGGVRTFLSQADAHLYRKMLYAQYGLPPPQARKPVPRVITFQRKRANRRIVNEPEFLSMLAEFGEVRVVEFNASTPFKEQLETIAATSVLVSVHTSNLANAQFLQPGSAVFEIIQRNWFWHGLDRSFQVQTAMMGDIHHYALRCRRANETVYIQERDKHRFGDWEPLECNTEECVEAHTNVDVRLDIPAFRSLLADRLPLVFAGWPVEAAAIPWPVQEGADDDGGMS
ncbi:EGF domain-specific O-linked N-acetylglucosamine transferase [Micractinium conductrix]|uniref:EGF domain-specific O-linked N-acetylglucosamine transferase n=1 Tax=Micractinium conductrix TaxID=554055 RepID=A0A2P6VDC5_9CHLO|nr:EGF domain-specific O-linked N-acetylglucosamine transferase [Micractinium conductrix]|eukprot:PSC72084.1 EGF domain-specific O-linked N-acetylglucosamine transferase [Micractinium conductrix]